MIEVVVGVLVRDTGEFLFTQRPEGKPMASYWEFPGGKVEQGESHQQALERELHEELGIHIEAGVPWRTITHEYAHAHVRLHFLVVKQWQGVVQGRERQAWRWQNLQVDQDGRVSTPNTEPMLPATVPLLADLVGWVQSSESWQI